jgi:hypothetical protein
MSAGEAELGAWLKIIMGEYQEMPGLQLTRSQVLRLWGLDASVGDRVLERLQAEHFLRVTPRGCYVLAEHVKLPPLGEVSHQGGKGATCE